MNIKSICVSLVTLFAVGCVAPVEDGEPDVRSATHATTTKTETTKGASTIVPECRVNASVVYVGTPDGGRVRFDRPTLSDLAAVGVAPISCCMGGGTDCIDLSVDLCIGTLASLCAVHSTDGVPWVPYCNDNECWCVTGDGQD
jgi:hypothetical protein